MEETRTRSGDDVGEETVIDPRQSVAHPDTSPDGPAVASRPTRGTDAFETTSVMPRGAAPIAKPSGGSSSDPPTKFLRGIEQHIELPPGSLVDDLEIEQQLGEGAMGVVYKARHLKLGRQVAVKVISPSMGADPQALGRFEREARALATLRHPNIVDVYSFGELPDGRSYYSMEYLDGVTLYERLRGRVPIDEALDVLGQMAAALEAAHAAGIVHRDLKPENTFLHHVANEPRAVVKIVDWGLARLAVPDGVERTASGVVIGTPLYVSPEQARSPNVDGRTDVYALGVIAYELVLGRHPFPDARTTTAALAAHLTEPPPQPRTIWPEIPAALDLLMYSMLAKDPSYRPTLAQIRNAIASVRSPATTECHPMRAASVPADRSSLTTDDSPVQARPASSVPVDEPRASRRVFLALAGLVVLGVVVAAAVASSGPTSVGEPRLVTEQPRREIEIDASAAPTYAAPSIAAEAHVPAAPPAPPIDASPVMPRSKVDSALPSVARPLHDGGEQKSEPTVPVERDAEPATVDTATLDAGVEPADSGAPIDADAHVRPTTTTPSRRTPPQVPTTKKPLNRDVIIKPNFKKKPVTK